MQTILLRCPRRARFHFGLVGFDENMALNETGIIPHSDTLFSAIINTAALFKGARSEAGSSAFEKLLTAFETGKIRISSANFCWEIAKEDYIWFLPKPAFFAPELDCGNHDTSPEAENQWRKDFTKVQYLSKGVWESGLTPFDWFDPAQCAILNGRFVLTREEFNRIPNTKRFPLRNTHTKLYQTVNLPKVRVHAPDQRRGFFGQASVQLGYWHPHCRVHYYFMADIDKESVEEEAATLFKSAINLLVDQGIGGERRVGCGQLESAEWTNAPDSLLKPVDGPQVSLSLFSPASADELRDCMWYKTIIRGGRRITVAGEKEVHLHRLRMLREGAIMARTLSGQMVNINPFTDDPHPFYRLGCPLSIPLPQNLRSYVEA